MESKHLCQPNSVAAARAVFTTAPREIVFIVKNCFWGGRVPGGITPTLLSSSPGLRPQLPPAQTILQLHLRSFNYLLSRSGHLQGPSPGLRATSGWRAHTSVPLHIGPHSG